jgi:hypothetical protein
MPTAAAVLTPAVPAAAAVLTPDVPTAAAVLTPAVPASATVATSAVAPSGFMPTTAVTTPAAVTTSPVLVLRHGRSGDRNRQNGCGGGEQLGSTHHRMIIRKARPRGKTQECQLPFRKL